MNSRTLRPRSRRAEEADASKAAGSTVKLAAAPPRSRVKPVAAAAVESTPALPDRTRLSESVYEAITAMILSGELPSGRPVSELELARRLEVSRTPVHEAINQLVKDGLMEQEANRRPVVTSFTGDDVFDVYEMRKLLEGEAAFKAATRLDRPTLDRLQASLDQFQSLRVGPRRIERWVQLDDEFHTALAAASASPRLADDVRRYRLLHRVFNRTHTDPAVLDQAAAEHAAILAALQRRDPAAARDAMRTHLEEWQRYFVAHLARR